MPFLIENIIATATALIFLGLIVITAFVITALQRRFTRERFFRRLDRARLEARALIAPYFTGQMSLDELAAALRRWTSPAERAAAEETVIEYTQKTDPSLGSGAVRRSSGLRSSSGARGSGGVRSGNVQQPFPYLDAARELVERLGWQREWVDTLRCRSHKMSEHDQKQIQALGDPYEGPKGIALWKLRLRSSFLARCQAAQKLSRVPSVDGMFALLAGLNDPHVDVQELCVRKMGALRDPATLPILIRELIEVLENRSRLSIRILKSALIRFPLEDTDTFREALTHPNRRVRFFATDIVREMAERRAKRERLGKNDFTPDIYRLFTEQLANDPWDDVRARAAVVIAFFYDLDCNPILGRLLRDPIWFVRLHACRALADDFFLPLARDVATCLNDQNWLVREAAVKSLSAMGEAGLEIITDAFITTTDRYSAEQIAEEIQRNGLIEQALLNCDSHDDLEHARSLTRRLVLLNKTSMLQAYVMGPVPYQIKEMLIKEMSYSQEQRCLLTLQACAQIDPDPRVRTLAISAVTQAINRVSGSVAGV